MFERCHEHNTKLDDKQGEGSDDGGGSEDEPHSDKMGEQGVVVAMRVGKVMRRVVMTVRKVIGTMR